PLRHVRLAIAGAVQVCQDLGASRQFLLVQFRLRFLFAGFADQFLALRQESMAQGKFGNAQIVGGCLRLRLVSRPALDRETGSRRLDRGDERLDARAVVVEGGLTVGVLVLRQVLVLFVQVRLRVLQLDHGDDERFEGVKFFVWSGSRRVVAAAVSARTTPWRAASASARATPTPSPTPRRSPPPPARP